MNTPLRTLLLALCLWAAWSSTATAQTTADSLRRLILPAADDTLKVRRLTELARTLALASKYDSALAAANWAKGLAERLKDGKGLADALLEFGTVDEFQSQYNSAMTYHKQSLSLAEQKGYTRGIANALKSIGDIYNSQSQYPQALEYYFKSLKMREELGDKRGIASCLNSIGGIYHSQSQYPQALEYYFKSLKMREELGDKRFIARSLFNIGSIYFRQSQFPQALEYGLKSLNMSEEVGYKYGIASSKTGIGASFLGLGQLDSAVLYLHQGYILASEIHNLTVMGYSLHFLASTLLKQGQYAQALSKAEEALKLRKQSGEQKEASETQALLATIHAALGNYKAAYAAQTQHHALKDSVFNADNANRLTALQADYDAQKQAAEQKLRDTEARHKAELATQERERVTQFQYAAIAGVVLFVLALALAGRRVKTERVWWQRFDRFVSFAAVVMLVEFALLFLDPWLDRVTGNAPLWRMLANVGIAAVIAPLHGLVEARLRASAG
jgi:tetratricopeptide (TPR) repeat protein